jgi:precorrin-4 methylase
MAEQPPSFHFDDIPLEEARRIGRSPRMDPELYSALKEKIQALNTTAARMTLPEGSSPTAMKNRILRVAAELGVPVTVRRVPGGLIFWRSTDEDRQQGQQMSAHLQSAWQPPQAPPRGRRRRG